MWIFQADPPDVPTVIGFIGGLLFSLGAVVRRYINVSLLSTILESLLLFSIFCGGGLWFWVKLQSSKLVLNSSSGAPHYHFSRDQSLFLLLTPIVYPQVTVFLWPSLRWSVRHIQLLWTKSTLRPWFHKYLSVFHCFSSVVFWLSCPRVLSVCCRLLDF